MITKRSGIAVVVQIDHSGPPTNIAGVDRDPRGACEVIEVSLAIVVIKAVGILRKVSLEQIEMAVQIVIAHSDAHSGLLHAVIAERYSAHYAFFPERSVMVIHEQQTGVESQATKMSVQPSSSKSAATTVIP